MKEELQPPCNYIEMRPCAPHSQPCAPQNQPCDSPRPSSFPGCHWLSVQMQLQLLRLRAVSSPTACLCEAPELGLQAAPG